MTIDLDAFTELYKHSKSYRVARVLKLLVDSIRADNIDPDNINQNDLLLKPQNHTEEVFWNLCRERAKKDRKTLEAYVENGSLGGRPPMSAQDKKKAVEDITNNVGRFVGVNEVLITDNFVLPENDFFEGYRKTYPSQLLEEVETWLISHKKDCVCTFQWIGQLIQKFNKRKTGRIL